MNAPYRKDEVASLLVPYWPFPNDATYDDVRLQTLLKYIIPGLNKLDNGKWGCLTKTDQDGKIPGDILVWKDTNEVIDCLDSHGAAWSNLGVNTNPDWVWTAVAPQDGSDGNGSDDSGDTPTSPADNQDVLQAIEAAKQEILLAIQTAMSSAVLQVNQHLDDQVRQLNAALYPVAQKIINSTKI